MGVSRKIAEETGIPHPLPQLEFESICSLNDLIIIFFFPPKGNSNIKEFGIFPGTSAQVLWGSKISP